MNAKSLSTFVFLFSSLIPGQIAIAEDKEFVVEKVFQYGESCGQLAQLTRMELAGITHPNYGDQFFDFCKADSVYRCEDYNALLSGDGTLEDNGQSSCRYLPR